MTAITAEYNNVIKKKFEHLLTLLNLMPWSKIYLGLHHQWSDLLVETGFKLFLTYIPELARLDYIKLGNPCTFKQN